MNDRVITLLLAAILLVGIPIIGLAKSPAEDDLKIVIVRHGEKPEQGDNLSCQGENRALQLPAVLYGKFGIPDHTYVPSLGLGNATKHARMFQTVSPFAVKYNLKVNSEFDEDQTSKVADDVRKKKGTVLLVWEHSQIPGLAEKLGVENPPVWDGGDFDSIWIITYAGGSASLVVDKEGLQPSEDCSY